MERTIKFSNGENIPIIGFGTWQLPSEQIKTAVGAALDVGYRHIDTASVYENEAAIGEVFQDYFKSGKLKREDVFITTKLQPTLMAKKDVRPALEESLRRLQLDYVDLFLIHVPCGMKNRGDGTLFPVDEHGSTEHENYNIVETWSVMEDLVDAGKIKSIGLSNFNSVQVAQVYENGRIKPVTNQVECHLYFQQKELKEFCEQRGITITAYAPLGSPGTVSHMPKLMDDPVVSKIAAEHSKTPTQVLLKFLIQTGHIVVPKSVTPSRIKENFQVFDFQLNPDEMDKLVAQDKKERRLCFDICKGHPEYPFTIPY